jgi:hypothetical protein
MHLKLLQAVPPFFSGSWLIKHRYKKMTPDKSKIFLNAQQFNAGCWFKIIQL